jgi:hypothetical protein
MTGRIINEAAALRLADELARVDPVSYGRLRSILSRCPTVNTEGVPLEEEPIDQRIKRVVAEQLVHFKLPDGVRPKEVRLSVTYEGLIASITVDVPGEQKKGT